MEKLATLNYFDYLIFVVYFIILIWMSYKLGKGQKTQADYFVGSRNIPWWAIGLSTAATQISAIGYISVPAFVGLKKNGGMKFIQGEFALPLAMIFIMILLIPFFRKLELISVYEYLEKRFGPSVRYLISGVFLLSRGLATAVVLYAAAIVLSTILQFPLWATILIMGVITVIYDTLGGMKAVIYSDVLQMFILFFGAFLVCGYAVYDVGGFSNLFNIISTQMADRVTILDFAHHGIGDGVQFSFWPQLIGGFFLLASYYGCDQTQTQRTLSANSLAATRKSLIFNGFYRFPMSLLLSLIGLALGAYVIANPAFHKLVSSLGKDDYLMPVFIMNVLPHGIKAIIFVAIMSAGMSSLDSGINSLSAVTIRDFVNPFFLKDKAATKSFLTWSKATTVLWGIFVVLIAFFIGDISDTVLEAIGIVGSAFYGPILATFVIGVTYRKATTKGMFIGILAGVFFNFVLHQWFKDVFWMWWNVFGCLVSVIVCFVFSLFGTPPKKQIENLIIWNTDILKGEKKWLPKYIMLAAYFVLMILICWGIERAFLG